MATDKQLPPEGVGAKFSLPAMVKARDLTFEAVRGIAARMKPGVSGAEAHEIAQEVLVGLGMERIWHKSIVRIGEGTLDTFHAPMQPDRILKPNDIFYVDLGAVFGGHEGDAGDTFVVGDDPDMLACAKAARDLWNDVAARWRDDGLSGKALYKYATEQAKAMGWRLNWHVKGHRVSDFPHAIYKAGALGAMETCPVTGLWILEIQIAHPTRPIGAFYEDLLIGDVVTSANAA
jgi:methionine aminopeptidase